MPVLGIAVTARALVFVAREHERAILLDRSAAVDAALLFVERLHRVGEEIRRVAEVAVAEEREPGSPELIGPGLRDGVDDDARGAAVLGVVAVGDDLELLDVLLAVSLVRAAAARAADVDAVDLVLRHVAASESGAHRAGIAAGTGDERHQVEPVTAVEWQILHLARRDAAGQLRRARVDQRRFAGHGDGFLDGRELHREGQHGRLADFETEVLANHARRNRPARSERGKTDRHRRHHEHAGLGRHGGPCAPVSTWWP